ncbi:MAG: hypothetical protein ACW98X_05645 [Promethearchaeota archaeon]
MALEEYKYLMIDSEDFWGYDSSTYNENNNWYAKAFIVSKEEVENKPSLITELNLMPCAMFFLIDVEDSQGFTPTKIRVDDERMFGVVDGLQKRVGRDESYPAKTQYFVLNRKAATYKNMNEYEKVTLGRFNVNNLIFSNEDADFEKPKARLEELTQYAESFTETEVVAEAESFNAETLERINPTIVEGAEDIMGAESETFKSSNNNAIIMNADGGVLADTNVFGPVVNDNVIGQEYVGRVIGQDAEEDLLANSSAVFKATSDEIPCPKCKETGEAHCSNCNRCVSCCSEDDCRDAEEDLLANPEVFGQGVNENVVGQEYVGRVLGQDAESAFYPNGDGRNFGNVTADGQYEPLGANAEGVENDILSAEFNAESNEVTINTLKGEQFTVNARNGMLKNAEGTFDAEESEALSAEDMTIVMDAAGYVPSGEWGSMNPEAANQNYMWEFRNAEEVPSGEWGSMNPEAANQNYMWEFRNAEEREAQGYDDRDDESIGMRHRGKHKQSMKDRRDESKGMTSSDDPTHPYADVSTMSAEYEADTNIIDLVQDAPIVRNFKLSGWAASALVLGTAWVFGRRSMAKKDSMDAEIEVARTIGVVGGANDFGQDPVMIQESNKRHFFPKKFSGLNELDPSSPDFNPLSEQYKF